MNLFLPKKREKMAKRLSGALFVTLVWATFGYAQEAEVIASGKEEFRRHCALCHGLGGKGDSVMVNLNLLTDKPPDLTQLRKKNGGMFPFWEVYRIVDGRQPVKGHGTPDMPIWGDLLSMQEDGGSPAIETKTTGRILNIVHYLQSLQEK
jgi:mono/diheme cytochrome c family protein